MTWTSRLTLTWLATGTASMACLAVLACLTGGAMAQVALTREVSETPPGSGPDTVVLCPPPFRAALQPWLEYRQAQGHAIVVIEPAGNAYGIRQQIRDVAVTGNLQRIVLVGDAPAGRGSGQEAAVAPDYVPSRVVRQFGSEPEIATDNTYADIDRDGIADVAIGRLPVDTAEELSQQIQKIIDYESASPGPWLRRINVIAGTGGFGGVTDSVIERTSRKIIGDLIPPEYSVSLTWGNWSSPYCPDPREFRETTLARLNEGSLFWVYMGHGQPARLDYVRTPIGGYPMFVPEDVERVACAEGLPIALMLACYTGAFDHQEDCLAERLVTRPGGPIAAVCSSRVAMPYGMTALSLGLIEEYFSGDELTLGDMLLRARRTMILHDSEHRQGSNAGSESNPEVADSESLRATLDDGTEINYAWYRRSLKAMGEVFSPIPEQLEDEVREHEHLYHLLGDPLLRVRRPQPIALVAQPVTAASDRVIVRGIAPQAGTLTIELGLARDRDTVRVANRTEFRSDGQTLGGYQDLYSQMNERVAARRTVRVSSGEFAIEIPVPESLRGRCTVRGIMLDDGDARSVRVGAAPIRIQR